MEGKKRESESQFEPQICNCAVIREYLSECRALECLISPFVAHVHIDFYAAPAYPTMASDFSGADGGPLLSFEN